MKVNTNNSNSPIRESKTTATSASPVKNLAKVVSRTVKVPSDKIRSSNDMNNTCTKNNITNPQAAQTAVVTDQLGLGAILKKGFKATAKIIRALAPNTLNTLSMEKKPSIKNAFNYPYSSPTDKKLPKP